MKYLKLKRLQRGHGYRQMQEAINDGSAWRLEGSFGRTAMEALKSGACMLPKKAHRDAYGNRVPSRDELLKGTKGTFQNSVEYYKQFDYGAV
jgi:hypothetical protein